MFDERFPTILLFGAPGVGKGTQGSILGQIPGFYHLSCGDVFRSLNINSPEGREISRECFAVSGAPVQPCSAD